MLALNGEREHDFLFARIVFVYEGSGAVDMLGDAFNTEVVPAFA